MLRTWVIAALVAGGCRPAPKDESCLALPAGSGPVVARVGDAALTLGHIERRLREQGSAAQKLVEPERLKRFVEDQIRFELLVQAAKERGLDRDPQVVEAARNVMVRKLLQQDLGAKAFEGRADDEAIRRYYENHLDDYVQPHKRRIAHIQLAPTPDGKALAQSLIDKLAEQPPGERKLFRLLAAQHSLDRDSQSRGGERLTFASQDEISSELGASFAAAVFALEPGALSPVPVSSTRGWHVLTVLAEREARARGLADVEEEIRDRLLQSERSQLFEKYLGEIRQRYPVALYDDQLPALIAKVSEENP